ncbi:MAG TPA: hypothetical protein ACHBX0_14685 [Arsenophonus sp.]
MKLSTNVFAIISSLTFGCMSAIASPIDGVNLLRVDKVLESSKTVVDTATNAANTAVDTGADVTKSAADTVGNLAGFATGLSLTDNINDRELDDLKNKTDDAGHQL